MAVKKKEAPVSLDELEITSLKALASKSSKDSIPVVVGNVVARVISEIKGCDHSSPATLRSNLSTCWRVLGTVVECGLAISSPPQSADVFANVSEWMRSIRTALDEVVAECGFDSSKKDTLLVYSGFYLCYTSIVRTGLESLPALVDPVLACDLLLGLEAILPMDNKGICNVYKASRTEGNSCRVNDVSMDDQPSEVSFPEGEAEVEDITKSFEKYWAMIDLVSKKDPELLSETKWWGKFSQSATATFQTFSEGLDLTEPGLGRAEPLEYERKLTSFAVQLTSASFRRKALMNIVFMCGYLAQNSANALITAGAKNLLSTVLKSLPETVFSNFIETVLRFETHWVNWKSSACSKEICGPFEASTRIERGLVPFQDPELPELTAMSEVTTPGLPNPAITVIESFNADSLNVPVHTENDIQSKMEEFRNYVRNAILCDVSDEAEAARLGASDAGIEEALQRNNDSVMLWQFKRMRFNADVFSCSAKPPQQVETTMDTTS